MAWPVRSLEPFSPARCHKIKADRWTPFLPCPGWLTARLFFSERSSIEYRGYLLFGQQWNKQKAPQLNKSNSQDKGLEHPSWGYLSSPLKCPLNPAQGGHGILVTSYGHYRNHPSHPEWAWGALGYSSVLQAPASLPLAPDSSPLSQSVHLLDVHISRCEDTGKPGFLSSLRG